jgi:hypothetical protein
MSYHVWLQFFLLTIYPDLCSFFRPVFYHLFDVEAVCIVPAFFVDNSPVWFKFFENRIIGLIIYQPK